MSYERIVILILLLLLAAALFRPQPVVTVTAPETGNRAGGRCLPGGNIRPAGRADGDSPA